MNPVKKKESHPLTLSISNIDSKKKRVVLENYKNDLLKDDPHDPVSGRFASENLLRKSIDLVTERITYQSKNYPVWLASDSKFIGLIASKDFTMKYEKNLKEIDIFHIKSLLLNLDVNTVKFKMNESDPWVPLNALSSLDGSFSFSQDLTQKEGNGLKLENQVLKLTKAVNLRCLGFRSCVNFMLKGRGSIISLLLRANEKIDNEEAIMIQFIKEGEQYNQRLYVTVGKLHENMKEFVYIKKCEIPIFEQNEEFVKDDIIEVKCNIVDYGNDKLKINIEVLEKQNKPFKLKYKELFIPYFEDFYVYIAGSGECAIIKKFICEFLDRKEWDTDSNSGNLPFGKCHCKLF